MRAVRSEEHTSELQSPDTISYAVFCLKKKNRRRTKRVIFYTKSLIAPNVYFASFRAWTTRLSNPVCSPRFRASFFFNDTATTEIYTVSDTLSLHDALPIYARLALDVEPAEENRHRVAK